ncbi:hypothetical protein E2C01_076984 [Portunus trituberculatus]|uniref:Uncharacterized protein n=1 Tax=Portunus trituberculatus TaxID=210409 RepID=A0A5B7IJ33_PORTR|nr:hypothetical protein [Portunus trituberculatus]
MFLDDCPDKLLVLLCYYDTTIQVVRSELLIHFSCTSYITLVYTVFLSPQYVYTGIFPSTGVLLLCFAGAYWQPCDAVRSSRMVCGSKMGKKQAVEPFEWWPDEEEPCPPDQWRCRDDKECIPRSALCSNATECEDGSDESPRFCGPLFKQFHVIITNICATGDPSWQLRQSNVVHKAKGIKTRRRPFESQRLASEKL